MVNRCGKRLAATGDTTNANKNGVALWYIKLAMITTSLLFRVDEIGTFIHFC